MIEVTERKLGAEALFGLRSGGETGPICISRLSETGELYLSGKSYTFRPKGMFSAVRILEGEGRVLAQSKEGFFRRWAMKLVYLNKTYKLVTKNNDTFVINEDDQIVGNVNLSSISPRTWQIDLPKDWPPAVAGFVFYLIYMISMRLEAPAF